MLFCIYLDICSISVIIKHIYLSIYLLFLITYYQNIKKLISFGVDKVILGTAAVENIEFLKTACNEFNNKIALSLDVRKGYIALSGWKKQTNILATEFLKTIKGIKISRIIVYFLKYSHL